MTIVKITKKNNHITQVECDGHTCYGVEGEDILCAGLSCIAQTACLGLLMVAHAEVQILRDEKRGYLKCSLPDDLPKDVMHDCQVILNTALLGFNDLKEGYSDFIELEVK